MDFSQQLALYVEGVSPEQIRQQEIRAAKLAMLELPRCGAGRCR